MAIPAALAIALVGCEKGSGTEKADVKPESSTTTTASTDGAGASASTAPVAADTGMTSPVPPGSDAAGRVAPWNARHETGADTSIS